MITLPDRPSRGPLRGFWIAACLAVLPVPLSLGRRAAGSRGALLGGLGVTALCAGGLARPQLLRRPYALWGALARSASRHLTTYAAWVAHATALKSERGPGGLVGAGHESTWSAAQAQPLEAYPSLSTSTRDAPTGRSPIQDVHRWAAAEKLPRARWLLTCLAVLRSLQPGPDGSKAEPLPHDTYTLF